MTDSSIIQQARDTLAKWRAGTSVAPWHACEPDDGEPLGITNSGWHGMVAEGTGADTNLIVGTAGNPDLLDAIEAILQSSIDEERGAFDTTPGTYLAAAIIAADERMSA